MVTETRCEKSFKTSVSLAEFRNDLPSKALGVIPAGTSNGLAESLGWSDPYLAVKGLIEREARYIDAMEITTLEGAGDPHSKMRWDLHSVNWGMLQLLLLSGILLSNFVLAFTADVDYVLEHQSRWTPKWFRDLFIPIFVMLKHKVYVPKILSFKPEIIPEEDRVRMHYDDLGTLPVTIL